MYLEPKINQSGTAAYNGLEIQVTETAQLTPHTFELFDPDPDEKYPWSYYAENKALGVRINVDMAGAIRAIEEVTGKKFIHYEDIEKSIDLEAAYKDQWEKKWIRDNIYEEEEVLKDDAFEMIEEDERVLYDVEVPTEEKVEVETEVVDEETGEVNIEKQWVTQPTTKIVKQGKKLGEKSLAMS